MVYMLSCMKRSSREKEYKKQRDQSARKLVSGFSLPGPKIELDSLWVGFPFCFVYVLVSVPSSFSFPIPSDVFRIGN